MPRRTGTPYCNEYCWIIEMKDGKAREIVEYADTALINAALRYPRKQRVGRLAKLCV